MSTSYDVLSVNEALVRRAAYVNDFRVFSLLPDTPGDPQYFQVCRMESLSKIIIATPAGWLEALEWMQEIQRDRWVSPGELVSIEKGYLPLLLDPPDGRRSKTEVFLWIPDKPGIGDSRIQQKEVYRVCLAGTAHVDRASAYVLTRGGQVLVRAFRLPLLIGSLDMLGIPLTSWQPTGESSQYVNTRRATPLSRKES